MDCQGVDDDPHDGEQAECRALGGGQQRELGRHAERGASHEDRHGQAAQRGPVCSDPQHTEQHEDRHQRHEADKCGCGEASQDGRQVLLVHGHPRGVEPKPALSS
jgi:hypothetical protein